MAHKKTFNLHLGGKFSSLEKFAKELQHMKDEVFNHHVNDEKHDFKEWVKHSLKEDKLAENIEEKLDKMEVELEVLRYLVHESKKAKKKDTKGKKTISKPKKEDKKK